MKKIIQKIPTDKTKIDISKVTRLEVIGNGREFVKYFQSADWMLQDEGRTLKVFVGKE